MPLHAVPAFLRALDNVADTDTGYIARCPVFGCPNTLTIERGPTHYRFHCAEHTHDDVVSYLQCDTRTDTLTSTRAWEALMLAETPEAWAQLLRGHEVPADQLDQTYLRRLRARRLT